MFAEPASGTVQMSVVVPAHDEERVLTRCLDSVYSSFGPHEVQVVVVANGCTDRTADVARAHPGRPIVLELEQGSKHAALNAGDAVLQAFPRAYVDADVQLGEGALRAVARALISGADVAAPRPVFDLEGRPYVVRAFYETWQRLPFLSEAPVGNGVYVLSARGRARFERFPDVTADDLFVLRLFEVHERAVPKDAIFVVSTPRRLRYLLRVRRRVYLGNAELADRLPDAAPRTGAAPAGRLLALVRGPRDLVPVAVYGAVSIIARVQAARGPRDRPWERDDSTR